MSEILIDNVSVPPRIKAQLNILSKDIKFTREITKGGNGYLFFGENRILKNEVAVKFYYWGGDAKYHAEPSTLAAIEAPNILQVKNAGLLDGEWAYFVTPRCSSGDLDDALEKTEHGNLQAVERTRQILSGVVHLHQRRFLHRDLKPSNIYVGEDGRSIIGDFGSIKYIPEGLNSIPASSHAVLYRPPESIAADSYGFGGDIYQCGIILYQLLGGYLPYEEMAWLNKAERREHDRLTSRPDKAVFIDACIREKIRRGNILNISSLPSWVPENLRRVIRKATHTDPSKRYPSASAFHTHLNNIKSDIPDWSVIGGQPVLRGNTSFRICNDGGSLYVQKSKNGGDWRRDNSITGDSIAEMVEKIEAKI
ncbi:serine/threonine protein kinase [Pseudomonas chlororaphis]|uniref:serine/threonine protein kinase n=1 Tax=Pseudomonas chlororaphis TaxID=587753 RepID=UPI000F55CE62|nr:serine/threonine-protein kinase [Pseudomonas chlororaphis]AZC56412.1 serine/threonine protein kinase [Pseudomonas chlororaphis subsp. piscium]AZC68858.1 serine/threonine protein kinase [Pseudomonas chlororaphis subsp. piscium]